MIEFQDKSGRYITIYRRGITLFTIEPGIVTILIRNAKELFITTEEQINDPNDAIIVSPGVLRSLIVDLRQT